MRITDFGIAKYYRINNAKETSGTPGYMAPEVMKAKNHSYTVDFFALGIIGYEFMLGRRPYNGPSRREIKEQMLSKNVEITLNEIPNGWSEDAADFFNKLLQRKPECRLGYKGIWELKQHRWMKYFPWDKLINKELESPFIPEKKDNFDKKYCEAVESIDIETKIRYEKYKSDFEYDNLFKNFTYYGIITENEENNKGNKENKERTMLSHSVSMKSFDVIRDININKENKDNNTQTNNIYSNEDLNNNINGKRIFINLEKSDFQFNSKNNDSNNNYIDKKNKYRYQRDKIANVINITKPIKNYSISMKLAENDNSIKNKNKNPLSRTNNDDLLKHSTIRSQYINNFTPDDLSKNVSDRDNIIKQNKNCRSKTPVYKAKKNIYLEISKKKLNDNSIGNSNLDSSNRSLVMNQYQYLNYKENIRNLFSKKAKQKMNICSPGYYSKHSLQISCNSNKYNKILQKRNTDFNKSVVIGSINSISKSPKITTSTSNSNNGYKKRCRSISTFKKTKSSLKQSISAKNYYNNFMRSKSTNSRLNLTSLYNQNYSYVKRIKEINSFNYNNNLKKIMSNISSINRIKSKNKKKNEEIISSYSISSSNILKQIRSTNYNKSRLNLINKNNQHLLYKKSNLNSNQITKRNNFQNKIRVELELNADSQTFNKQNRIINDKNENSFKNQAYPKYSIKNSIINKNNSTINIGSMKMAMNGNININVVIKGNNNTTNLINKIEVKKKSTDKNKKNRNNKKGFERSHSIGYFKLNYDK